MKGILTFILVLAGVSITLGQYTVETSVSKSSVAANEVFTFEIVMNNFDCDALQPDFGGLQVISGPNPQQMSNTEIVNGSYKTVKEFKWSYKLRATEVGNYTISSVTMNCGDKSYTTDPISIEVVESSEIKEDPNYFLRLTTNKSTVYEGEPFVVSLKYYSKERPESLEGVKLGDITGISRYDLNPDRKTFQTSMERLNGVKYYTIELHDALCFAQRSGTVHIEPYYTSLIFRANFFNSVRKESFSNPLDIDVQPLPKFNNNQINGLVGSYEISNELNKDEIEIGEAIDYKIIIEGVGNLDQTLLRFTPKFPASFNTYDPQIKESTKATRAGLKGSLEFLYTVVPTGAGTFELPADTLFYFDLNNGQMQSLILKPRQLTVKKGEGYVAPIQPSIDEQNITKDIQYIDEGTDSLFERDDLIFGTWKYYGMLVSPLMLAFLFLFIRNKRTNLSADDQLKLKQKQAIKTVESELKSLNNSLSNDKETLKSLQSIFIHFFKSKFNVGLSELNQKEIENRLREKAIPDAILEKFSRIWHTIEMGQYAPIKYDNLVELVAESDTLIHEIDNLL